MLPDVKNNHLKSLHSSGKIKHLDPLNTEEIVAIVNGKERRMKEGRWSETKN